MVDIATIQEAVFILGIPVARSFFGWLNVSLEDGKITRFEVEQLIQTIIKIEMLALFAYLGLTGFGLDVNAVALVASAAALDVVRKFFPPAPIE